MKRIGSDTGSFSSFCFRGLIDAQTFTSCNSGAAGQSARPPSKMNDYERDVVRKLSHEANAIAHDQPWCRGARDRQ